MAEIPRERHNNDSRVVFRRFANQRKAPVRAAIVHKQEFMGPAQQCIEHGQRAAQKFRQHGLFVVQRNGHGKSKAVAHRLAKSSQSLRSWGVPLNLRGFSRDSTLGCAPSPQSSDTRGLLARAIPAFIPTRPCGEEKEELTRRCPASESRSFHPSAESAGYLCSHGPVACQARRFGERTPEMESRFFGEAVLAIG